MGLSVGFASSSCLAKATALAKKLMLPLDNAILPRIVVTEERLELWPVIGKPIWIDFDAYLENRREIQRQGLVKACKPDPDMIIWDATAGWGRDAAILSSFGARVMMFEQLPWLAALLEDGLHRKSEALDLSLTIGNSETYMEQAKIVSLLEPQVIYIDPMHPERNKTALVKKEMQVLQQLIAPNSNVEALIEKARARCIERVVVKWPQRLPPVLAPNYSIAGKTIRFDVYRRI